MSTETTLTGSMTAAYCENPILKKSAETILTRFDTTNGKLAVSAIKPAAMMNAKVACGEKRNASSMAMTIGVRISAAPSLANSAETAAPSKINRTNNLRPLPPPQRATCSADHSKKPALSKSKLMIMMAMKVPVAFQTMCHTTGISDSWMTPNVKAMKAPADALQPM